MEPADPLPAPPAGLFRPGATVMLFLCIALLLAIADRAPLHLDKDNPHRPVFSDFYRQYQGVLDRSSGGPYAYRVLVPWIISFTHQAVPAIAEIDIDAALKIMVLFFIQAAFFRYLLRFLTPWIAFAGTLWMDLLIGYSLAYVLGPAAGETTDLLNLLVFVLVLDLTPPGKTWALLPVFAAGMLNRETPLILLPLVYAVDRSEKRGGRRTALLAVLSLGLYGGLRLAIPVSGGSWFTTQGLGANIPGYEEGMLPRTLQSAAHLLILLGPLFGFALQGWRHLPLLFRGSIVLGGFLVLIHYIVGTVIESRLWMPEFALLVPPSLFNLRRIFNDSRDMRALHP